MGRISKTTLLEAGSEPWTAFGGQPDEGAMLEVIIAFLDDAAARTHLTLG